MNRNPLIPQRSQPRRMPAMSAVTAAATEYARAEFFSYNISFANLLNGTATTGAIQIQADSDFELQKLTCYDATPAGQGALPLATIQLTDTGTGRQLFNTPIIIPAVFGSGQLPFILPVTRLFTANSTLQVQVSNVSGATLNLELCFLGSKLYR